MNFYEFAHPVEHHKELNPKLWDDKTLKPDVAHALAKIAHDFYKYIDIPFKIKDIVIAGGNANYNYTQYSDIDLHLIADYSSIQCDREAAELFDSKRLLYKSQYDVKIHGIPVELYVEDSRLPAVSASYSIIKDEWIRKPPSVIPYYDNQELRHMTEVLRTVIQHATQTADLQACRHALKLLRHYRKMGLASPSGEYSIPNLVYKSLRNDDTVKGIQKLIDKLHDQELSIS